MSQEEVARGPRPRHVDEYERKQREALEDGAFRAFQDSVQEAVTVFDPHGCECKGYEYTDAFNKVLRAAFNARNSLSSVARGLLQEGSQYMDDYNAILDADGEHAPEQQRMLQEAQRATYAAVNELWRQIGPLYSDEEWRERSLARRLAWGPAQRVRPGMTGAGAQLRAHQP